MALVSFQHQSGIAEIRLERPEAKNAISLALLSELESAIALSLSQQPRVLVFFGKEGSFSSGADLKERSGMSESQVRDFLSRIQTIFRSIERLPFPTIAVVDGFAFGGGLELALACDLRFFSERASVGLTETKLGIIPGAGGTQRLTKLVGASKAKEWIFSARRITAKEANDSGLANAVFPTEQVESQSLEVAKEIAKSAPLAVKAAKQAIDGLGSPLSHSESIWETICYEKILGTEDRKEALVAFREKREPNFKGR